MSINGKLAVVTGAGGVLCSSFAKCLAENGARVMLLDLNENNIKDLAVPFLAGAVYNKLMGNSISIKSILPALYPNDPSLNYNNLQGIHNGNEAMIIYPKMKTMTKAEREKTKQELLEYCKLDTFAMVKIYEFLVKSASK